MNARCYCGARIINAHHCENGHLQNRDTRTGHFRHTAIEAGHGLRLGNGPCEGRRAIRRPLLNRYLLAPWQIPALIAIAIIIMTAGS